MRSAFSVLSILACGSHAHPLWGLHQGHSCGQEGEGGQRAPSMDLSASMVTLTAGVKKLNLVVSHPLHTEEKGGRGNESDRLSGCHIPTARMSPLPPHSTSRHKVHRKYKHWCPQCPTLFQTPQAPPLGSTLLLPSWGRRQRNKGLLSWMAGVGELNKEALERGQAPTLAPGDLGSLTFC